MQTFPNSTERSSDFNSTSNLVLTKSIPRHCFVFSKNWQTSSFSMNFNVQNMSKQEGFTNSEWCLTPDPWSGQSAWSGDGMTPHQGTWVRAGVTNHSPVLDPDWPMGGERDIANTGMTGNRSWPPSLSQARPAFLSQAQYIKYFFQPSPYILANKSLDIFTNKHRETRPSSRLNSEVYKTLRPSTLRWCFNEARCLQLTLPPLSPSCVRVLVSKSRWHCGEMQRAPV